MRILHTSDWHLGRSFGPISLRDTQEKFCDHLCEVVTAEGVDLVVIAGDIYDRAIAPTESIELFRSTVRRLRAAGTVVAAITGNHDGADRVASYDDLLDASGVYLRGGYEGVGRVIRHEFADGPLEIALLPFLEPQAAPDGFGGDALAPDTNAGDVGKGDVGEGDVALARRRRRTHQSVLADAVAQTRRQLTGVRSLAVGHAFVIGGLTSDSERQLEVGGTGAVAADLFEGFSYTALGHLHRPQEIGRPTLRYSGTPMPYSFSEDHEKSLTLVDLGADGASRVEQIPLNVGRQVTTLRGYIDELLQPGRHPDAVQRFVRAIVTDRETVLDAKSRLEKLYPHVVEVRLEPEGAPAVLSGPQERIEVMTPLQATTEFWAEIEGSAPEGELHGILAGAVAQATGSAAEVGS